MENILELSHSHTSAISHTDADAEETYTFWHDCQMLIKLISLIWQQYHYECFVKLKFDYEGIHPT